MLSIKSEITGVCLYKSKLHKWFKKPVSTLRNQRLVDMIPVTNVKICKKTNNKSRCNAEIKTYLKDIIAVVQNIFVVYKAKCGNLYIQSCITPQIAYMNVKHANLISGRYT